MSARILYLVHDLADPAVGRRVAMLKTGGAEVTLAGFARRPVDRVEGIRPITLGRTSDGRMGQRILAVLGALANVRGALSVRDGDVVLARNLEMLAVAHRLVAGTGVPVAYECLDIHRLLARPGPAGASLRTLERTLANRSALLVTSSLAFVREHFEPAGIRTPVLLLENKVFAANLPEAAQRPPHEGPIRIGWFGTLRCHRSFDALSHFTRRMEGRFEVRLMGRPAAGVLDDLAERVASEPFMHYGGPYRYPDDLASIYGAADLVWAVDFYEEGQNSSWLLPNRLYEGGRFGAVPVAMATNETGRFLKAHGIGIELASLSQDDLDGALTGLDAGRLDALRAKLDAVPASTWACGPDDCAQLVERLTSLRCFPDPASASTWMAA